MKISTAFAFGEKTKAFARRLQVTLGFYLLSNTMQPNELDVIACLKKWFDEKGNLQIIMAQWTVHKAGIVTVVNYFALPRLDTIADVTQRKLLAQQWKILQQKLIEANPGISFELLNRFEPINNPSGIQVFKVIESETETK